MDKKISIIVPVYKVEKYLDRCVESIVGQEYKNLEIFLVNDGSPDRCPQMCDTWAMKDPRVRVIHKENGGQSSARNMGIDAATGDYLYFVDSDDYIAPQLCRRAMECFEEGDADMVIFNSCRISREGISCGGTETLQDEYLDQNQALLALLAGKINSYPWNKVYKRKVFADIRYPEGRVWEDVAIAPRLFLNARRIRCIPEMLYYYCDREDSTVARIHEKALADIFLARYDGYALLKQYSPEVSRAAFSWVALAALNLYDRSLWAKVNHEVLKEALNFLSVHRAAVLEDYKGMRFRLYYTAPALYKQMRLGKHAVGNVVKRFQRG